MHGPVLTPWPLSGSEYRGVSWAKGRQCESASGLDVTFRVVANQLRLENVHCTGVVRGEHYHCVCGEEQDEENSSKVKFDF